MRYALVEAMSGHVLNVIECDPSFAPGDGFELVSADSFVKPGDNWTGSRFERPPSNIETPQQVSDYQFRMALSAKGLRSTFEEAIENAPADARDFWDRALAVPRHHWFAQQMMGALKIDDEAMDDVFRMAQEF